MSVNVTEADKNKFLQQDVNEYIQLCEKNFEKHKYECAEAGLTIGHTIISEFWRKEHRALRKVRKQPQATKTFL